MKGDKQKPTVAECDGSLAKPVNTRRLPGFVAKYLRRGEKIAEMNALQHPVTATNS